MADFRQKTTYQADSAVADRHFIEPELSFPFTLWPTKTKPKTKVDPINCVRLAPVWRQRLYGVEQAVLATNHFHLGLEACYVRILRKGHDFGSRGHFVLDGARAKANFAINEAMSKPADLRASSSYTVHCLQSLAHA